MHKQEKAGNNGCPYGPKPIDKNHRGYLMRHLGARKARIWLTAGLALLMAAFLPAATPVKADSLAVERERAYERISTARRAEMNGGFVFGGIRFATDDHSRLLMFGAWQIATGPDDEIDWKVGNGKFVTLRKVEVMTAWRAMVLWIEQLFSKEKQRTDAIIACRDKKCVEAVKW